MDWSLIGLVRKPGGVIDFMVCVAAALVSYQFLYFALAAHAGFSISMAAAFYYSQRLYRLF